jgi:SEC-C motif
VANKSWYEIDPELFANLRRDVEEVFPELRFVIRDRVAFVTGYYPLFEGERVYDRYLVEIELSKESPKSLPIVREIGKRIPRTPHRHMNSDGAACVVLPDAFWHENPDGMNLLDFLQGPLRGYLASQSLVELGVPNPWPSGEWAHGVDGLIEFYANLVGIKDSKIILQYLEIIARETVKGHWRCPCGSGEKLRKCHRAAIDNLRSRIPRKVVAQSLETILRHLRQTGKIRTIENQTVI